MRRFRVILSLATCAVAACNPGENGTRSAAGGPTAGAADATDGPEARAREGAADPGGGVTATPAGVTQGLQTPESVRYDPDQDVFFVSNINGHPARKDNNGWIGRVSAGQPGPVAVFIAGGRDGVFLHAPKGMAIQGDTLWVADIDILRGFDKHTGKFVAAVGFWSKNVAFLNDVVLGGDGALYITDTGISFDAAGEMKPALGGPRIYRLAGRAMTEEAKGDLLAGPNGITYDSANTRFILAPFGGKEVQTWRPGAHPARLAAGPGMYDGVEIVNGRIYVTSWADSAVHVVEGDTLRPIIRNVAAPADIGVDTRRRVLAVPRFNNGRVEYYRLP
jgi:sugar lactone lactonase YvrE